MPLQIEKCWQSIVDQRVSDDDGNTWAISEVIEHAKTLKEFDCPICALSIDRTIGGMKIYEFVQHMKMVLDADLDLPIILDQHGSIFDGRHRAAKALLDGKESIKAVRFEKDPSPTYRK
jgi:hypothetical protein